MTAADLAVVDDVVDGMADDIADGLADDVDEVAS